ncbi:tRNA threonylcarbamoyladenosine dehydratase [Lachnospiraceae bacterium oral taxon 500]|nr:tRNA threonylcarbamoyladenosine dehydratase [Lachnospiraceae bacterium oral taxon 500]
MTSQFDRTAALIGETGVQTLRQKKVAVFGLGGVGSFAAEALARAGIGSLLLVDKDVIEETNLNRQLYALHSTVGKLKVEAARQRCLDINPDLRIDVRPEFYLKAGQIDISGCDYVVDAIDNVTAKLQLIADAKSKNIPIIVCLGTGNQLDNTRFQIADITRTTVCPLAKVMRRELKARGITDVKVVFSTAEPVLKQKIPASISFVPPVAGFYLAGEVIRELLTVQPNCTHNSLAANYECVRSANR